MSITAFSDLLLTISEAGTVPSVEVSGKKTYADIGTGNVFKVSWNTPVAANNQVDSYIIHILMYDSVEVSYKHLYKANIGNVNEFYAASQLFAHNTQSILLLRIYLEAVSSHGVTYNGVSDTLQVTVCKGCGIYQKVADGYKQPVMKRSIAMSKLDRIPIVDNDGKILTDVDGNSLYAKSSPVQDDLTGWTLMQEFFTGPHWQQSDMQYEVLTDTSGEIVTDVNGENIYVL